MFSYREPELQTHSPVLRHSVDPASKMGEKRETDISRGVVVVDVRTQSKANMYFIISNLK